VQSGGGTYVILAVDDTQVERLFYVLKNADWTLDLRPAAGAKNGPSRVETPTSVLHEAA
jgi:hypothetical protein